MLLFFLLFLQTSIFSVFHPSSTFVFCCMLTCSLGHLINCTKATVPPRVRAGLDSWLVAALITSRHLQFKLATLILSAAPLCAISCRGSTAATHCSFKAAARLAHAKTSYSGGEQAAASQRKLCFNVIRDWSTSVPSCNDAVFPCLSDNGLMASISRP